MDTFETDLDAFVKWWCSGGRKVRRRSTVDEYVRLLRQWMRWQQAQLGQSTSIPSLRQVRAYVAEVRERSEWTVAIVGQATVVVERSTDDHLQGIAMKAEVTRLALLVWARPDQLAALLARLERRVVSGVWPPGSARLEWIGNGSAPLSEATRLLFRSGAVDVRDACQLRKVTNVRDASS